MTFRVLDPTPEKAPPAGQLEAIRKTETPIAAANDSSVTIQRNDVTASA